MSTVAAKKWLRIDGCAIEKEMANAALQMAISIRENGKLLWILRDILESPALTTDVISALKKAHRGIDHALILAIFHVVRSRVRNRERLHFDKTPY